MSNILIFGLGNPGREYEETYHNAGFMALSSLRKKMEEKQGRVAIKPGKTFAYWKYGNLILAAANPQAEIFMNDSGRPVQEALNFFKLAPEKLFLFHDDSDLRLGDFKLEFGRGAAGHHGVESVIAALGTPDFWRARIGIRPEEKTGARRKAEEFVLRTVTAADRTVLEKTFQELAKKVMEKS